MDRNYWDCWANWKCPRCGKEDTTRGNMMSHSCPLCGKKMTKVENQDE